MQVIILAPWQKLAEQEVGNGRFEKIETPQGY